MGSCAKVVGVPTGLRKSKIVANTEGGSAGYQGSRMPETPRESSVTRQDEPEPLGEVMRSTSVDGLVACSWSHRKFLAELCFSRKRFDFGNSGRQLALLPHEDSMS